MSNSKKHIAIICNPLSGKGKPLQVLATVEEIFKNQHVSFSVFKNNLPELNTFTHLLVLGGDGTLNYTLNFYKNIPIPLGIIPCGTGNDIAYALLGRKSVHEYINSFLHGKETKVDVGQCNQKLFLNGGGFGFEGWVVRRLLAKRFFTGLAAYYSTVVSLLMFYRETATKVIIDGQERQIPLFMFSAANGPTVGGGFHVAPGASFSDGQLDFLTVGKINLLTRIKYLPLIEKGKHLEEKVDFLNFMRGREASLSSDKYIQAHLDGEWLEAKHFDIKILPAHLTLII